MSFSFITRCVLSVILIAGIPRQLLAQDPPPPRSEPVTSFNNFLACHGNKYSLCYYSGPPGQAGQADLPCVLGADSREAYCKCYSFQDGKDWNFVAIGSILNAAARQNTQSQCGEQGESCINVANLIKCHKDGQVGRGDCKFAPVCNLLGAGGDNPGDQTLYPDLPGSYSISTFSFKNAKINNFGSTDCSKQPGLYAGCMTAPCSGDKSSSGFSQCICPTYDGPFQVGQYVSKDSACNLAKPNVWSASNATISPPTLPKPSLPQAQK